MFSSFGGLGASDLPGLKNWKTPDLEGLDDSDFLRADYKSLKRIVDEVSRRKQRTGKRG